MPSNKTQIEAFARTRLQQIARLATLQRERADELNVDGRELIQRASFSMVMDCRMAGVDRAVIDAALTGNASESSG